ncbi:MAG: RNA polymerase sigma factor [Cyclobacteriaceae bacterium]
MSRNQPNEDKLLESCLKGSPSHQAQLYYRYKGLVMGICLRYGGNVPDAEDIYQEAYARIFANLKQVREESRLPGWIRKVTVSTAINYLQKQRKHQFQVVTDYSTSPPEVTEQFTVEEQIEQKQLMQWVQELPAGSRVVFNMYVIEGYSHKEIGQRLQISELNSRSQLSRARKLLKEKIALHSFNRSDYKSNGQSFR